MKPFQQRVVDEKKELDDRIKKLASFTKGPIILELPTDEQDRLTCQRRIMIEYSRILGSRIANFT